MDVIDRLKALRTQFNMTQVDFGKAIGMSQGNISEMERGKFNPSIDTIISACKYFNISANWLLLGEELPADTPNERLTNVDKQNSDTFHNPKTYSDPELEEMIEVLKRLTQSGDSNVRGWAIIQFKRTFAEYCATTKEK